MPQLLESEEGANLHDDERFSADMANATVSDKQPGENRGSLLNNTVYRLQYDEQNGSAASYARPVTYRVPPGRPKDLGLLADSYENEFALAASAQFFTLIAMGLVIAAVIPGVAWANVATTTGPVELPSSQIPNAANATHYFPIVVEEFSLWTSSCATPGMRYTYNYGSCKARYIVVQAFTLLACVFEILAAIFGIMPFSPVAPRNPRSSLMNAMLSQMFGSLFALIAWAVFYGGLMYGVLSDPVSVVLDPDVVVLEPFTSSVAVVSSGIIIVSAWCISFIAWLLALAAMIKYDEAAAERAIMAFRDKKEERERRRADLIARLGEDAELAAQQGIALDLGDRLYLGGATMAGATAAVAWANNGVSPVLLADYLTLARTAGAILILNVLASTCGALVLLMGLADLIPRPKASMAGFAMFAFITVAWIADVGMSIYVFRERKSHALDFTAAVGTLGIATSLITTVLLYHPFKIWERSFAELPRPAKSHKGLNGLALATSGAVFALLAFCLCFGAMTVYIYDPMVFAQGESSSPPSNSTGSNTCANLRGDKCNIGPIEKRCCAEGLSCVESAYTIFTCQPPSEDIWWNPVSRTSFPVGQAFLALEMGFSMVCFVFALISLAPNGVMGTSAALAVVFSTSLGAFVCGLISFCIFQTFVLNNGGNGMPPECGYLLGAWISSLCAFWLGYAAWRPYHASERRSAESYDPTVDLLERAQREADIERLRLEAVRHRAERRFVELRLEETLDPLPTAAGEARAPPGAAEEEDEEYVPSMHHLRLGASFQDGDGTPSVHHLRIGGSFQDGDAGAPSASPQPPLILSDSGRDLPTEELVPT